MNSFLDILIVDYRLEGLNRYAIGICSELHKLNPNLRIGACYMQKKPAKCIEGFVEVFCAQDYSLSAKAILEQYKPRAILTFAHRFFDYMFTVEAHSLGIIVFNFQHGLYMDNTVISELSAKSFFNVLLRKYEKLNIYLRCSFNMNQRRILQTIQFLSSFIRKKSLYRVVNEAFGKACNADVSYIFGEYWKRYYEEQYHEKATRFVVVGYPELEGPKKRINNEVFDNPSLDVICYLAQTSVEDGVLPLNNMQSFIEEMEKCLTQFNLVIKFHPRSDHNIYSSLLSERHRGSVLVWNDNMFPDADMYIGHESTVVARAMETTAKTMIIRLNPNRESPFEKYACFTKTSFDGLSDALCKMALKNDVKIDPKFQEFVWFNHCGALRQTAQDMDSELS